MTTKATAVLSALWCARKGRRQKRSPISAAGQPVDAIAAPATPTCALTAIWQVSPHTGRIECRWTNDPAAVAAWLGKPAFERVAFLLAASPVSRFSGMTY